MRSPDSCRRRQGRRRGGRWARLLLATLALGLAVQGAGALADGPADGVDGADGSGQQTEQERAEIEEARRVQEQLQRQLEELEERQREIARRVQETQEEIERRLAEADAAAETEAEAEIVEPSEAPAPRPPRPPRVRRADQKFSFGSTVRVREGEVAADVVSIGGGIKIDGEVRGGAVAVGGQIKVDGRVTGDVIAFGHDIELGDDAEVLGNVVSVGGRVDRAAGARVVGEVSEVGLTAGLPWGDRFRGMSDRRLRMRPPVAMGDWLELLWSLFATTMLIVLGALLILVAPDAVNRTANVAGSEFFKSLLVGLGVGLLSIPALVVLAVVLTISIIGIPLLLLLPFVVLALLVASLFGFISVGVAVGRRLAGRLGVGPGRLAYLVTGIVAIQTLSMLGQFLDGLGLPLVIYGLFGLLGFVVQFLAWTSGLGAAVLTRFGSSGRAVRLPPPPLPTGDFADSGELGAR
ncbi:MAG TPA: polymer-forming cytoskeletal protein [Thermoanaerobaculia bacterium]|nr:polymer-forming cytoskeletal protein [Thermoanaerobaculia bacterium]